MRVRNKKRWLAGRGRCWCAGMEAAVDESSMEEKCIVFVTYLRPRPGPDYIIPGGNPGNEYGSPGSKEVCLPGVKIPEMSMEAREARKCVCRV